MGREVAHDQVELSLMSSSLSFASIEKYFLSTREAADEQHDVGHCETDLCCLPLPKRNCKGQVSPLRVQGLPGRYLSPLTSRSTVQAFRKISSASGVAG